MENNNYFEIDIKPREEGKHSALHTAGSMYYLFPYCRKYGITFELNLRKFEISETQDIYKIPTIRIQFDEKDFRSFMYAFYMFVHGVDYYHQKTPYFTFEEFCEEKNVTLPDYNDE